MQKRECPSCAVDIDSSSEVCPICGYEFPRRKSGFRTIAVILILLFIWPLIRIIMHFIETL